MVNDVILLVSELLPYMDVTVIPGSVARYEPVNCR